MIPGVGGGKNFPGLRSHEVMLRASDMGPPRDTLAHSLTTLTKDVQSTIMCKKLIPITSVPQANWRRYSDTWTWRHKCADLGELYHEKCLVGGVWVIRDFSRGNLRKLR